MGNTQMANISCLEGSETEDSSKRAASSQDGGPVGWEPPKPAHDEVSPAPLQTDDLREQNILLRAENEALKQEAEKAKASKPPNAPKDVAKKIAERVALRRASSLDSGRPSPIRKASSRLKLDGSPTSPPKPVAKRPAVSL